MKIIILEILIVSICIVAFFWDVRRSQLAPHRLTVKCGTSVLSDRWITNRYQVTAVPVRVITATGFVTEIRWETNELWNVWGIFE